MGHVRWAATPGLQVLDWAESTAVVFNPNTASTHLISGEAADLLTAATPTAWQALDPQDALLSGLAQAGLLQATG